MKKTNIKRLLKFLVGAALLAVFVYVVSITARLTSGVSLREPTPTMRVRLQVVTPDGSLSHAREIAGRVSAFADPQFAVDVVDVIGLDLPDIARSMIVAREEDRASSMELARRMGMDPDEVEYRPLEHNTKQVTATLIMGPDIDSVVGANRKDKESQRQS